MRKLSVALFALVACGGNNATTDAAIVRIIDARPLDAALIPDVLPVDAQAFDFTCLGKPEPTTAPDPITISGTTQEVSTGGLAALAGVSVASFKTGTATALNTVTSGAGGVFASGNLVTGGTPLAGFVQATVPPPSGGTNDYRATFVYPPAPLAKSLANAPVIMVKNATFNQLAMFAGFQQNDTTSGALFIAVIDCANTPINGATLSIKQGTTDVGADLFDLGAVGGAQAAGTYFVFNVPAGATDISATYGGHTFPVHSVMSYKKDATTLPNGALTLTIVRPGPQP